MPAAAAAGPGQPDPPVPPPPPLPRAAPAEGLLHGEELARIEARGTCGDMPARKRATKAGSSAGRAAISAAEPGAAGAKSRRCVTVLDMAPA